MPGAAESGRKLAKSEYEAQASALRTDLLNAQFELREAPRSVLVMIVGDDRPGAAQVYNLLHEWMDARYLASHAFGPPEHGEECYPPFWRYWRALPPAGRLGVWLGGWLQSRLRLRLEGSLGASELAHSLDRQRRFERLLAADGVRIVKLWIHLSEREHARRLKKAKKGKGEWRLDETDWRIGEDWPAVTAVTEEILAATADAPTPWHVVEGGDERHRNVTVGRALLDALRAALDPETPAVGTSPARPPGKEPGSAAPLPDVLGSLDLSESLSDEAYDERIERLQRDLFRLANRAEEKGVRPVLVFQGFDAAGKGGAIRRITRAIDARDYRVVPIGAPTPEERQYPWLWRFWRHLTPAGRMVIFDRSWYGRVLVERVEGFAPEADWRRAYDEINDFEAQLLEADSAVLKFFLHIDRDEQLRRFRARERTPYKKYKITADDYRNRERWDAYSEAVAEMVARTDTERAPWHLVPANDKRWARVAVLETVCRALRRAGKR